MKNDNINHLFICRLLNICANRAVIEDALETRETILCAAELVRYMYDSSKTVVPLNKEIEIVNIYIDSFLMDEIAMGTCELKTSVSEAVYIDHMALLSFIIGDYDNNVMLSGATGISYEVVLREDLYVVKRIEKEVVLEFRISTR